MPPAGRGGAGGAHRTGTIRRIGCVGGGPAGLFFALLAKRADESREVTVFERNRAQDTFGFGVVFSDATLARIDEADPILRNALRQHGVHWDPIEVRLKGERLLCGGMGMAAVARKTLLGLLQERALEAGVQIRFETEVDARLLAEEMDLVVAADGANSRVRSVFADQLSPTVDVATAKFIWFGTTYPFDGLTFVHERGPHGVFAVHGYPIGGGISTFIVETDEKSWRAAGLDAFDVNQPPGPSDEGSRRYLEKLFAEQIDGASLLENNSRWSNFRTWRTRSWSSGRTVLVGDAAHTAHFSVGSGTKMAMEDAVALAESLDQHPDDLAAVLSAYEDERRPKVTKIQDSARPSLSWWEHFGRYHDSFEPWQFGYHFLTRSLTDSQLAHRDQHLVDGIHERWRILHGAAPLETPTVLCGMQHGGRLVEIREAGDPHGGVPDRGAILDQGFLALTAERPHGGGKWAMWLDAPADEGDLPAAVRLLRGGIADGATLVAVGAGTALTRRLLAETARLEHGTPSLLMTDDLIDSREEQRDWAETMVLSGRTDLVGTTAGNAEDDVARR